MVKRATILIGLFIFITVVYAQSRGTPSQLRVRIDANGALVVAAAAQVNPVTTVPFNNARLALDASGNLLTVVSGGAGVGTVTSIATTSPITGGTITTTGTIGCATCGITGSPLSQFASTTSAQLAATLSNETGTGVAVFNDTPSFTTSIITPVVVGGTTTTSTLSLRPTSGAGTTGSDIILGVGSNGATEAARFYSTGVSTFGLPCSATGCDAVPSFGFQFTGVNIAFDRFNAGSGGALIVGRHARGTVSAPGQTLANDNLSNWIGRGWQSTTPAWATGTNAAIVFQATENYTSTAQGARIQFQTMQTGTVVTSNNLTISASGLETSGPTLAVANVGANSCGTTTATIAGNATVGEVTVGATSGTQCRVTIPQAVTTRFNGSCNNQTTANLCRLIAVSTTTFDLVGTFVAGDVVAYVVMAR